VFTEAELKAFLRPKPKQAGKSVPRIPVGSSTRFPGAMAVDADTRRAILEAECGGWLRDEDVVAAPASPAPLVVHDGTLSDLPVYLDRRKALHIRAAAPTAHAKIALSKCPDVGSPENLDYALVARRNRHGRRLKCVAAL